MPKQRRNALMFFALTLIYCGLHLTRSTQDITLLNTIFSLFIPVIAIIFALNVTDFKWRWSLITVESIILAVMLYIAWVI